MDHAEAAKNIALDVAVSGLSSHYQGPFGIVAGLLQAPELSIGDGEVTEGPRLAAAIPCLSVNPEGLLEAIDRLVQASQTDVAAAEIVEAPGFAVAVPRLSVDPEGLLEVPDSLLKAPHVAAREDWVAGYLLQASPVVRGEAKAADDFLEVPTIPAGEAEVVEGPRLAVAVPRLSVNPEGLL